MNNDCNLVIFSDKAYNAIIRETFEWEPVETGGILLGHILDNGVWLVMEVLPPGYGEGREGDNVHHEYGYFEYNQRFVNYLAKSVAEQYDVPPYLLGLWHRHPGSMDVFSGTDDVTNKKFAAQNPKGTISGLVNVDPQLRMTMYHLAHNAINTSGRPPYQKVEVEVMSMVDIPEAYRKLRFYDGTEKALHPYAPQKRRNSQKISRYDGIIEDVHHQSGSRSAVNSSEASTRTMPLVTKWFESIKKKELIILIVAVVCFLISLKPLGKNVVKIANWFNTEKVAPKDKTDKDPQAIHGQQPSEKEHGLADETPQTPQNGNTVDVPQDNQPQLGNTNNQE